MVIYGIFARIGNLIRGFLSLFVSGIEKSNPRALIEAERERLREKLAQYNSALARQAGFVESLKRQIGNQEREDREITARVVANHRAGNAQIAGELALRLQRLHVELARNREQHKAGNETYEMNIRQRDVAVRDAKEKIEGLMRKLTEVEMKEAEAALGQMLTQTAFKVGDVGDNVDRVANQLEERYADAAGKARVAQDSLDKTEIAMKEGEHRALADAALAEFLASTGEAPQAAAPSPETEALPEVDASKELGPA